MTYEYPTINKIKTEQHVEGVIRTVRAIEVLPAQKIYGNRPKLTLCPLCNEPARLTEKKQTATVRSWFHEFDAPNPLEAGINLERHLFRTEKEYLTRSSKLIRELTTLHLWRIKFEKKS